MGLYLVLCLLLIGAAAEDMLMPGESWVSGYLPVRGEENQLFYFLVKSRDKNPNAPLLVWLNGGPGCSSTYGLFQELGPHVVDPEKLVFKRNEYSWNNNTDMLFIDNPVEVGFSTVKDDAHVCINQTCVANDFYTFMIKFLEKYPEYEKRPLYLSGESYGGHYIPAIAARIMRNHNPSFNLKGIAVGNPFTTMEVQMGPYALYLYENKNISILEYVAGKTATWLCQVSFKLGLKPELLTQICEFNLAGIQHLPNGYDIRMKKDYTDIDKVITKKLFDPQIMKLIGSKKEKVELCNDTIYNMFAADLAMPVSPDIEYLLANKLDVILYFGNKDYMCNWRGGEALVDSFKWEGSSEFKKMPMKDWKADGVPSGKYRKHDLLNFMVIFDAGHLVPMDKGMAALRMLQDFMGKKF